MTINGLRAICERAHAVLDMRRREVFAQRVPYAAIGRTMAARRFLAALAVARQAALDLSRALERERSFTWGRYDD